MQKNRFIKIQYRNFPVKFLRKPYLKNTSGWLVVRMYIASFSSFNILGVSDLFLASTSLSSGREPKNILKKSILSKFLGIPSRCVKLKVKGWLISVCTYRRMVIFENKLKFAKNYLSPHWTKNLEFCGVFSLKLVRTRGLSFLMYFETI